MENSKQQVDIIGGGKIKYLITNAGITKIIYSTKEAKNENINTQKTR